MKKKENIMAMFNLPAYTNGKPFAVASKMISERIRGKKNEISTPEAIAEEKEMQGRLQQAQEYVKSKEQPAGGNQFAEGGELDPDPTDPGYSLSRNSKLTQADLDQASLNTTIGANQYVVTDPVTGKKVHQTAQDRGFDPALRAKNIALKTAGQPIVNPTFNPTFPVKPTAPVEDDSNNFFLGGIMDKLGGDGGLGEVAGGLGGAEGAAGLLGKAAPGIGAVTEGINAIGKFADPDATTADKVGGVAKTALGLVPGGGMLNPLVDIGTSLFNKGDQEKELSEAAARNTFADRKMGTNSFAFGGSTDPNKLIGMLNEDDAFEKYLTGEENAAQIEQEDADVAKLQAGFNAEDDTFAKDIEKTTGGGEEESGYDPTELLRYAPIATDTAQLLSLKKPEATKRDKLGNKYKPQQVDERGLLNTVQEGVADTRNAILGSSGGSQSAARANLLGLNVQGTKALSNAMQTAGAENRADNVRGQQFDLGVDQTNLAQSNAQNLADEQNQGAYETQKSQLVSQLGANFGEVGKEALLKKYPELMGMDFDSLGKFLKTKNKKKGKIA
jgi:hypothetical protein